MPPKGKTPGSDSGGGAADAFLFVNEDFSTLFGGAKNANLDRSKQSHVQRHSFAKRRRSRRSGRETSVSPANSEDAQSPITGSGFSALRSQSDSRLPLLPFPASNSLWLPVMTNEDADHRQTQTQSPTSLDRPQVPRWRSSISQLSPSHPYPLPLLEQAMAEEIAIDPRLRSDYSPAVPTGVETSGGPEDFFSMSSFSDLAQHNPFNNLQVALESWAPTLMRYYTTKIIPEFFYTDLRATSLQQMRHAESLHEEMRSCMNNPAEMYALLAASSSHVIAREGRLDLPGLRAEDSDRVPLLFKSKAFEALRIRLANGEANPGIVMAIQRMIWAALYSRNFPAIEAHYQAVLSMIRAVGGLETFNDFQKERLIMHDFYQALNKGSAPRLELSWDPGQLGAEANLELVIHTNQLNHSEPGDRIRAIAERSEVALHPVVAQCIPELVETQQVLEWLRQGEYRPFEYKWLTQRRLAIIHRLLNVDGNASTSLLEVVRFALLYYCVLVRAVPYSSNVLINQYAIPEIKTWEANAMVDAFGTSVDLLLWVAVMFGIGTWQSTGRASPKTRSPRRDSPQGESSVTGSGKGGSTQDPDATTLVTRIGRVACKTLGIETESQLRASMRTFLFDDDFVDDRYLAFVREGLQLAR